MGCKTLRECEGHFHLSPRFLVSPVVFMLVAACRPSFWSSTKAASLQSTSTPTVLLPVPSSAPLTIPLLFPSPYPSECRGELASRSLGEPLADPGASIGGTVTPTQLAHYLNIMGIQSLCIPRTFGAPTLNVDWHYPEASIGRMISIGFDGLYSGPWSAWGRAFIVYSTYDFEVGSEYETYATQDDLQATRSRSMPRMITVDGSDGFIRFIPALYGEVIDIAYIIPFETHYLAAVFTVGQYDPALVNDNILQMETGQHPDLANPDLPLFIELVSSIQFE